MIKDLKELKQLLQLCRKQGVQEITLADIHIKLGDLPAEVDSSARNIAEDTTDPYAAFPTGVLTNEQLMFYSSGGLPDQDPSNQEAI